MRETSPDSNCLLVSSHGENVRVQYCTKVISKQAYNNMTRQSHTTQVSTEDLFTSHLFSLSCFSTLLYSIATLQTGLGRVAVCTYTT